MKAKVTILLLLLLLASLALCGCGGDTENTEPAAEATAADETAAETTESSGGKALSPEDLCQLITGVDSENGKVDQFVQIVQENGTYLGASIYPLNDDSTELGKILVNKAGDLYFSSDSLFQPDFTKDCLATVLDAWGFSSSQIEEVNSKVLDYSTPVELLVLDLGGYRFSSFWDNTFSNCLLISPGDSKTDYQEGNYVVQPYTTE